MIPGIQLLLGLLLILFSIFYFLLPLLIYWRCGRILRQIERLDRNGQL